MDTSKPGIEARAASPREAAVRARLSVLIVVAACVLVYANALRNDFVFDDVQLVKDNEAIRSIGSVPEIFTGNLWGILGKASNYYRPLPPLLYMATYGLFGLTPWAFHLLNVVLHAGASILVFLIASRLLRRSGQRRERGPGPARRSSLRRPPAPYGSGDVDRRDHGRVLHVLRPAVLLLLCPRG